MKITDSWTKKVIRVEFLEDPTEPEACGIFITEDLAVNEIWSTRACEKMVEAGEMKFFDNEIPTTREDLLLVFDRIWELRVK